MISYPGGKHITVHLIDGTDRKLCVSLIQIESDSAGNGVIVRFGRDDGRGWCELLAAPLTSIVSWDLCYG
jgi:hypothetical protein